MTQSNAIPHNTTIQYHNVILLTHHSTPLPDDLQHMSAVRLDAHTEFAKENDMASFLMSAKNGDQVNQAFWKIASYLSGGCIVHNMDALW